MLNIFTAFWYLLNIGIFFKYFANKVYTSSYINKLNKKRQIQTNFYLKLLLHITSNSISYMFIV